MFQVDNQSHPIDSTWGCRTFYISFEELSVKAQLFPQPLEYRENP